MNFDATAKGQRWSEQEIQQQNRIGQAAERHGYQQFEQQFEQSESVEKMRQQENEFG